MEYWNGLELLLTTTLEELLLIVIRVVKMSVQQLEALLD